MAAVKKGSSGFAVAAGRAAVVALAVSISAVAGGCYFFPKEEEILAPPISEPQDITYDTITVEKGSLERSLNCTFTFVSYSSEDLFFQYKGGRLRGLYINAGDKIKKGDLIAELDTESLENDITLQKIALERSTLSYEQIKIKADIEGGGDKYELELAKLNVEADRIRLDNYLRELEKSKIYSPIDGEIVYVSNVNKGDYVNAYDVIAKIADPTKLYLQYGGDKVGEFSMGMKVIAKVGDREYPAEVVMTPATAPLDEDETVRKSVRVKLDELPPDTGIGDFGLVHAVLDSRDNVVKLPKMAVKSFLGRRFVNVLNDGLREERDVEVGLETDTEVEIISGLEVGEQVIVR